MIGFGAIDFDHLLRHCPSYRKPDEHVGIDERVGQRPSVGLAGEPCLVRIGCLGTPFVDHAVSVAKRDVRALHAQANVVLGGGNRRRAGAGEDDPNVFDLLPDDLDAR